jgi:hypothetical protein
MSDTARRTVRLRKLRRDLDLTLDEVAAKARDLGTSIDRADLSRAERDLIPVREHWLPVLSQIFKVPADRISKGKAA